MDEQQRKTLLKETFNAVADGYDGEPLRFFPASAEHLADLLPLSGTEQVLDVACGTGHAALALARRLPRGRVTAIDFSAGMLGRARRKAAALGIRNIEFLERDMQALGLPQASFDAAVCAFGIFFVDDMERQLSHFSSVVKPGGMVMISSFSENYFSPLKEKFFARAEAFGVPPAPQNWRRIANEAGAQALFKGAGLRDIRVERRNVGYSLGSAGDWWDIVWSAGLRRMVTQIAPEGRERFKQEHLAEIEALRTEKGIWLDVEVLYTSGKR